MKNILLTIMVLCLGHSMSQAQTYPIANADDLGQLVVSPDMEQIKLLIFNDNVVNAERFLYFAVIRGLAKDGMPLSIANHVAKEQQGENFVPKCKICESTKRAFADYSKLGTTYHTETNPAPELAAEEADKRHEALKTLIDKYSSSFITLLNLSQIEQEKLQNALGLLKKQGMAGLKKETFGSNFCPSCSGATHE